MRNQRMDLFKCIAIYSVVFLHIKSGVWDWPVTGFARFAVPYFFLVSGYFSFGQTEKTIAGRLRRAFFLWAAAMGLVIVLCTALVLRQPGRAVPAYFQGQFTPEGWRDLLLFQTPPLPYSGHIWFIGSLPVLYLIWWGIMRFCRRAGREIPYRLLGAAAAVLLGIHILLGEVRPMLGGGETPSMLLRNAWLDGLPFFLLGVWVHYGEERLKPLLTRGRFLGGLALGGVMALAEQYAVGYHDLFAGSAVTALLLLLAAVRWPEMKQDPVRRWMCACGRQLTFSIYAIHYLMYCAFTQWSTVPLFGWVVDHPAAAPFLIALFSTAAAVLINRGKRWAGKQFARRQVSS